MSSVFGLIGIFAAGFVGLMVLLVLFVVIFGKRIERLWEYEAKFRNELGQEFGEFEIEMSKVGKEPFHTLKAELKARHELLESGQVIEVYLDDETILRATAETDGLVLLDETALVVTQFEPTAGQICRVVIDEQERWTGELKLD